MKKLIFLFYIWITTFAWITLIFFLSLTTQELNSSNTLLAVIINTLLLTFLLLLIYRSALASVRIKVIRLSVSHTKQEAKEDKEFSDLVRVLLVIISILSTFLINFRSNYCLDNTFFSRNRRKACFSILNQ